MKTASLLAGGRPDASSHPFIIMTLGIEREKEIWCKRRCRKKKCKPESEAERVREALSPLTAAMIKRERCSYCLC